MITLPSNTSISRSVTHDSSAYESWPFFGGNAEKSSNTVLQLRIERDVPVVGMCVCVCVSYVYVCERVRDRGRWM